MGEYRSWRWPDRVVLSDRLWKVRASGGRGGKSLAMTAVQLKEEDAVASAPQPLFSALA